jgi:1-phosphatidylinositol-3-phosphate 5-kinase
MLSAEQLRLLRRIQKALDPYLTTFISVSATLHFSPPHALHRMKELDDELIRAKHTWEDEVVRREEKQPARPIQKPTLLPKPDDSDVRAQIESLSGPDFFTTPLLCETPPTEDEPGYFDYKPSVAPSQITLSARLPANRTPIEEPLVLKTADDIALESRYSLMKWQHQEQQRVWE